MDFEQNDNLSEPSLPQQPEAGRSEPPQPIYGPAQAGPPTAKTHHKGAGWKIFWGIVLALSVLANIALFFILIAVVAVFAAGQQDTLTEEVIREGPRTNKIAVITLQGIIDDEQAEDVYVQIKRAREDKRVKGMILRVNSPGGTISGSDQIYNEIRNRTEKPVVAFMQGVAASGGYYTSVACDKIVAEHTTITGSIGVIAGYLVLEKLLDEKLGVQAVIIKSGEKKDWPSSFRAPSDEEIQYLREKLIKPAYDRFVHIVAEGRASVLTLAEVEGLADGSIYGAEEAIEKKLIDEVGYLDTAIEQVKSLAGIEKAQVVQYYKPFSLTEFLSSHSSNIPRIDKTTLYELSTPQLLYLWTIHE